MNWPRWTQDEDDFIRTHPDLTDQQLTDALDGRTLEAVKLHRRKLLGARRHNGMVRPTDQEHTDRWRAEAGGAR